LNTARERHPSRCARFTNSSLACSASQRALLLERLGISHHNAQMSLSEKQKKHLRRLAHPLHPIVMLGNAGLTDAVVAELDRALADHELVKVSTRVGERKERDASLEELARRTSALLVQRVGHVGVLYRRSERLARILVPDE
jgi:RNA-binding protein